MTEQLSNIIVRERGEKLKYKSVGQPAGKGKYPTRESRASHGQNLEHQFQAAWKLAEEESDTRQAVSAATRGGVYLQIKGKQGYDLLTKSLENIGQDVRLLNIQHESDTVCATVFVPNKRHDFFIKKIKKYAEKDAGTDVIGTIESIQEAMVEGLWTGDKKSMPSEDNAAWCEVWLRYSPKEDIDKVKEDFFSLCEQVGLQVKSQHILFPERMVVGGFADRIQLAALLEHSSQIAEFRKMFALTDFLLGMERSEQMEFIQDLVGRIDVKNMTNTSVCLIDTGVNNGHPLLEKVLDDKDKHTIEPSRGIDDKDGHGTKMAGISTFFTLEDKLEGTETVEIEHFLESAKLMDKGTDNPEELYGELTAEAISLAEINRPTTNRAICMAVTANTETAKDGRPSSWSGAIDSIISGSEEENVKRLMFISAGNTTISDIKESGDYMTAVHNNSVQDPGQSWNAITVGAFTEKDVLEGENYTGYKPVATFGGVSPFTSSSITWDHSKWPIKPEIVFEGGNLAYSQADDFYSEAEDLSLLTTGHQHLERPLETIAMTSSAAAQASWMGAKIWSTYPDLWPETVRALVIHSAQWTDEMRKTIKSKGSWKKSDYRKLLRTCGYGVPNINKALWCASNSVNLIIQDELQPFTKKDSGSITLNEMHIHSLPWPKDLLQQSENIPVKMRVTVSYFIEPGPGEIGWKDKYRYPSCGLLFDVNNPIENKTQFVKRISVAMREDEEESLVKNDSSRWMLGVNNRSVGSIHSDIWEGTASELSESNLVIIYPKAGWWKSRQYLKKFDCKIRYSLVISIETPEAEVDLYTAIKTQIQNKSMVRTEITAL